MTSLHTPSTLGGKGAKFPEVIGGALHGCQLGSSRPGKSWWSTRAMIGLSPFPGTKLSVIVSDRPCSSFGSCVAALPSEGGDSLVKGVFRGADVMGTLLASALCSSQIGRAHV